MAKSKNRREKRRVPIENANRWIAPSLRYSPVPSRPPQQSFVQDARRWSPERFVRPLTFRATPAQVVPYSQSSRVLRRSRPYPTVTPHLGFEKPSQVLTCVRRKVRKEVLHAFRKTGRYGQKTPRFTPFSKVRCR